MKHMMVDRDGNVFGDWSSLWKQIAKKGEPLDARTWDQTIPSAGPWRLAKVPPELIRLARECGAEL